MGKRHIFHSLSKWLILILILATLIVAGKQEKEMENTNFFQIGKELVKNGLTKQMLYSQSVILGFLMEQELPGWNPKPVMKTEGFLPYEKQDEF